MIRESSKILIADDFQMVRFMLKDVLKQLNMTNVAEASNGAEALNMLLEGTVAQAPYELIFCDWNMPEMDGMELLKTVRKTPSLMALPFILVTAESDKDAMFNALTSGASDYIVKPFSAFTLRAKIEKIQKRLQKAA